MTAHHIRFCMLPIFQASVLLEADHNMLERFGVLSHRTQHEFLSQAGGMAEERVCG